MYPEKKAELILEEGIRVGDFVTWQSDEKVNPLLREGEKTNKEFVLKYGEGPFKVSKTRHNSGGIPVAAIHPPSNGDCLWVALWRLKKTEHSPV